MKEQFKTEKGKEASARSKIRGIIRSISNKRGFTAFQRARIKKYLPHIYYYFYKIELLSEGKCCRDVFNAKCPQEVKSFERIIEDFYPFQYVNVVPNEWVRE